MFDRQRIRQGSRYLTDESKMTGEAEYVVTPNDVEELKEAMRINHSKGNRMTVSGMRTGLCGGCVPKGGYVLSLERMSGVIGIGRDDRGYFVRTLPCTTVRELNRVLTTRDFSRLVDVTPGAVDALRAEPVPWFYPVDPTELDGSIGGNIACNSSGPRTYRYGPTRGWVRRLSIVLADGQGMDITRGDIVADGRRLTFPAGRELYSFEVPTYKFNKDVKNAAGPMFEEGMDLVDLFIGSEGVFGIVAEADVYLTPWHPLLSVIAFLPTDGDALDAISEIKKDGSVDPEFLEYMDCGSVDLVRKLVASDPAMLRIPEIPEGAGSAVFLDLAETEGVDGRLDRLMDIVSSHGGSPAMVWCGHEDRDRERMRAMRHSIPASIFEYVASLKGTMPGIHKMGTDMSVPDDRSEEMMAFYSERLEAEGLEYVIFGHMGNCHPHVEIILKSMEDFEKANRVYDEFARKAVELGGSPSAEHGIGKIKRHYMAMMYGEDGVEELRRVKDALDPKWMLCPGNILEEPR
ncbi:MAG: FAD-binding oxidoreductase [Thermoplasmata archaeon]|nr:FAD-binding oxidoreductase [Thermoplasmata archaeon]